MANTDPWELAGMSRDRYETLLLDASDLLDAYIPGLAPEISGCAAGEIVRLVAKRLQSCDHQRVDCGNGVTACGICG
jgi:hypothetical protein